MTKAVNLPSFEDVLMTWDNEVLELTLSTGQVVAGHVTMSADAKTVWLTGRVPHPKSNEIKLVEITHETAYRAANVIGVRHLASGDDV